jgi:hypothetical protein
VKEAYQTNRFPLVDNIFVNDGLFIWLSTIRSGHIFSGCFGSSRSHAAAQGLSLRKSDLVVGVDDGRVIFSAEFGTNLRQGIVCHHPRKIHGDLPWDNDPLVRFLPFNSSTVTW